MRLNSKRRRWARKTLCLLAGVTTGVAVQANPQGPSVAAGTASFTTPNATTLEIANSPNAIINWQSFDIGVGETTRFVQQSAMSAVLNRVTTQNPSDILGNLVSNGRVFLVNPAGIVVGRDGVIDTAGLVMSTLNITNENFLAGRYEFTGDAGSGEITNHGYIKTAPNGEIVLLAPRILNAPEAGNDQSGIIESEGGELVLAAGYSITITSLDDPDISFEVTAPAGEVVNLGQLIARGGSVEVLAETIRHSGEINADALSVDASGRIVLTATQQIETTAASLISARGERTVDPAATPDPTNPLGAAGGNVTLRAVAPAAAEGTTPVATSASIGGRIDVSGASGGTARVEADTVRIAATVDASGKTAGGTVQVLGDAVKAEGATLRANADTGNAGDIRFGGEFRGADTLRAADSATIDGASRFEANATTRGDGGEIVIWSDVTTVFAGKVEARGGLEAGDGGMIEVSGKETLQFSGGADVGAPRGEAGTLLLDPRNIRIVQGGATVSVDNPTPFAGDQFGSSFQVLANGNILVVNQNADASGLTDAGRITLLGPNGNLLGTVAGNATNERLGAFGSFTGPQGNLFFRSPDASSGGLASAGALIFFNITTGAEIGRSRGVSANELYGQGSIQFSAGNLIVASSGADIGGNVDAGSVVVVSGATGTELGRLSGTSASEFFGSTTRVGFTAANTFVVQSASADVGGNVDAGRVVMGSSLTGQQLGQVVGAAAGDQFGATVDYFATGAGTYLIRSAAADVGGLIDAGTAILVDHASGNEIGRTSGLAAGDNLGSIGPLLRSSGNYFLQVPNADVAGKANAGSLVLVSGTGGTRGTRIGSVDGTGTGEQFGASVDTFSLGGSDVLVISAQHDNPGLGAADDAAGGVFVIAASDLDPGANIQLVRGSTLGKSVGEQFGSSGIDAFVPGGMLFISQNADSDGFTDNGSVVLVGFDGNEAGRVVGSDDNEFLGSDGIILANNGNYWIPSTNFAPIPSTPNVGSVILASGSTGAPLGRFDGTSTGEQFGNDPLGGLFNGDLLVRAAGHGGGVGIIAQLASVDLDPGVGTNILRGAINGATVGDLLGAQVEFLPGGNYVVAAPSFDAGATTDAGRVFVVDGTTAAVLGAPIAGNAFNENLGDTLEFDLFQFDLCCSLSEHFAILSAGHGGNSEGAVFFVDGSTGALLGPVVNGGTGDTLGGLPLEVVAGSHIAIRNPLSDVGGSNAGEIRFIDPFAGYTTSGSVLGISANEALGDANTVIDLASLAGLGTGMFLIHTPDRDVSGKTDAGAVLIMQGIFNSAVTLQGAVSGLEDQDFLGLNGASDVQLLSGGRFLLFNSGADDPSGAVGGVNDEGAVILASATAFNEIGRFYGQTDDNEALGLVSFATERPNGNFFIHSPSAGANNEGALYLGNGSAGTPNGFFDDLLIGRVDGTAPNENFGANLNTSVLSNGDVLVLSQNSAAGAANGGTVVQVVSDGSLGGGNLVRGRLDGGSANEQLGSFSTTITAAGDGLHYFVTSRFADPSGLADAGSIYFMNQNSATLVNRVDGISANEQLGSSVFFGNSGNLFVRSVSADIGGAVDAGRLLVVAKNGATLGQVAGNAANEFFGSSFQFVDNDLWVFAPAHNNGAGGIFAVANADLGGGNVLRNALLGAAAGDALGSLGASFISSSNALIRVPLADVGGIVDAGSAIMVNRSLQVLGRTDGSSANEQYGTNFQFLSNGNLLFRSPNADVGGIVDAGVVKLVDPATGNLIGQTAGSAANERFGLQSAINLGNNGILIRSPNAAPGGLVDAGAVVQISAATGLEIQRIVGTSAGELFGNQFPVFSGSKLFFGSPLADVGGITDAGRIVLFDPTSANQGAIQSNVFFTTDASGDFVITTGAIANALNSGAHLILESNNDILLDFGATLTATAGKLTLRAGRSVSIKGLLNLPDTDIEIVVGENQTGIDLENRDSGVSEFAMIDPQLVGKNVSISADLVTLLGGSAQSDTTPLPWEPIDAISFFKDFQLNGTAYPATFVLGLQSLKVTAETLSLTGGDAPGAFAALVSLGEFDVEARSISLVPGTEPGAHAVFLGLGGQGNFDFESCEGCGTTFLFTDPFLEGGAPVSGFYVTGLLNNLALDSILAMLDREEDEDEQKKRCN